MRHPVNPGDVPERYIPSFSARKEVCWFGTPRGGLAVEVWYGCAAEHVVTRVGCGQRGGSGAPSRFLERKKARARLTKQQALLRQFLREAFGREPAK